MRRERVTALHIWRVSPRARGHFIVMGDGDDTYDFDEVDRFVEPLAGGRRHGHGLAAARHIHKGAMPPLHRYVGNPVLTGILNLFYGQV